MRKGRRTGLGVAVFTIAALLPMPLLQTSSAQADVDYQNPGMMGQADLDNPPDAANNPGWPQAAEGTAGRPVVTAFSVGGTSKLSETADPGDPDSIWTDGWRVVIAPSNVCRTGQTPAAGSCYASPNRLGVVVAYDKPSKGLLTNFAGSELTGLSLGVDTNTEVDLTIDLKSFGSHLGWTWMNGEPTYWNISGNTLHVKGKLRYMPSSQDIDSGCTRIPVEGCDTDQARAEHLTFGMVVSVDDTLPDLFDGVLFASEGAVIGSLEVNGFNALSPSSNALTYGIAAPHRYAADYPTVGGEVRSGTFYAVVPDAILTSAFGVAEPATADLSALLAITRSQDRISSTAGTDVVTWTAKSVEDFGTTSHLLKIDNISFSAPKFRVKRTLAVKRYRLASASRVRDNAGVPSPRSSQRVVVSINSGSRTVCRAIAWSGQIQGLKRGTCNYTVKLVKKSSGRTQFKKVGSLRVT